MKHRVMVVVVGLYLLTAAAVFANSMGWSPLKKADSRIQPTNSEQPSGDSSATPWEPFQPSASKLEFFTITPPAEPEVQPQADGNGGSNVQGGNNGGGQQQPAGSPTMRDALGGGGQEQPSRGRRRSVLPPTTPSSTTEPAAEPTTQQLPPQPSPTTGTGGIDVTIIPVPTTTVTP